MVEVLTHARQQGIDEQVNQTVLREPVLRDKHHPDNKQEIIDKINQNKVAYRAEQERLKAEQTTQMKVGLPEMERTEALQEERQANPHQNQVFAGAKATERFRMGKAAMDKQIAQKKHSFEMTQKDGNDYVLKAANNPVPKKDDLNKELEKQEREMRSVFKNPRISPKKKVEILRNKIKGIKGKAPLKGQKQIERAKRLIKEAKPKQRQMLLTRLKNNRIR